MDAVVSVCFAILIENLCTKKKLYISGFKSSNWFRPRTYTKLKFRDLGLFQGAPYTNDEFIHIKILSNREGKQFMEMIHVSDHIPLYTGDYIDGEIIGAIKKMEFTRSVVFTDSGDPVFGTCNPTEDKQKQNWFSISIIDADAVPDDVEVKEALDGIYKESIGSYETDSEESSMDTDRESSSESYSESEESSEPRDIGTRSANKSMGKCSPI